MQKEKKSNNVRILTLGSSAVGKTSLVVRFTENRFFETHISTIGVDFVKKEITLNGTPLAVQIWDSAGQEKYKSVSKQYFQKAQGILLVFDLTSRQSFNEVSSWLEMIKKETVSGLPIVLVGNKSDLSERQISEGEANEFANDKKLTYFETSASKGTNVNEAFHALVELTWKKESQRNSERGVRLNKEQQKKKTCC